MKVLGHGRAHMQRWSGVVLGALLTALALAALALGAPAWAAPGDLDPTFSDDGKQTTDFGPGFDSAFGAALQADGKIVLVGDAQAGPERVFAVARYNPDGSLDPTFSDDGKQTTDFVGFGDRATGVAVQADGKLVVGGTGAGGTALARYVPDGSLDPSFGVGGKVTAGHCAPPQPPCDEFAAHGGVALQADGKIVAAGTASVPGREADFGVARFNSDGSLDTAFASDGVQTTDFGGRDEATGVALQADGKIVVAGGGTGLFENFALAGRSTRPSASAAR
jgi:uncharacterized delta-60 repeat protein